MLLLEMPEVNQPKLVGVQAWAGDTPITDWEVAIYEDTGSGLINKQVIVSGYGTSSSSSSSSSGGSSSGAGYLNASADWVGTQLGNYALIATVADQAGIEQVHQESFQVVEEIISNPIGLTLTHPTSVKVGEKAKILVGGSGGCPTLKAYVDNVEAKGVKVIGGDSRPWECFYYGGYKTLHSEWEATSPGIYEVSAAYNTNVGGSWQIKTSTIEVLPATNGCPGLAVWDAGTVYVGGNQVQHNGNQYQAKWWTQGQDPASNSGPWQVWSLVEPCS